jgi:hypothetical protein
MQSITSMIVEDKMHSKFHERGSYVCVSLNVSKFNVFLPDTFSKTLNLETFNLHTHNINVR